MVDCGGKRYAIVYQELVDIEDLQVKLLDATRILRRPCFKEIQNLAIVEIQFYIFPLECRNVN